MNPLDSLCCISSLSKIPDFLLCFAGCPLRAALLDGDYEHGFHCLDSPLRRDPPGRAPPWPASMVRLGSCSDVPLGAAPGDDNCEQEYPPARASPATRCPWQSSSVAGGHGEARLLLPCSGPLPRRCCSSHGDREQEFPPAQALPCREIPLSELLRGRWRW
jgi:hypothetical protein